MRAGNARILLALVIVATGVLAQPAFSQIFQALPPSGTSALEPVGYASFSYLQDATGDGILDYIHPSSYRESISCAPGVLGGGFGPTVLSTRLSPGSIAQSAVEIHVCQDLDMDGMADLVTRSNSGIVDIWRATGGGAFQVVTTLGGLIDSMGVGDLTSDGRPELVARTALCSVPITYGCWRIYDVTGLLFNQIGEIADPGPFWLDVPIVGDFDGDGFRDIAAMPHRTFAPIPNAHWYRNTASAPLSFTYVGPVLTQRLHPAAVTSKPLTGSDVNNDGFDDLVVYSTLTASIAVNLGSTSGLAANPVTTPVPFGLGQVHYFHFVDLDRDGMTDLFVEEREVNPFLPPWFVTYHWILMSGSGDGSFRLMEFRTNPPALFLSFLTSADRDSDGDLDFMRRREGYPTSGPMMTTAPVDLAWIENLSIYGGGVSGSAGTPRMRRSRPLLGNAGFFVSVDNARPGSLAILGIATAAQPTGTQPGGLWLSTLPGELLYPAGPYGLFMTDATGTATAPLPLPLIPSADGLVFYGQWGVLDPAGSYSGLGPFISLSDAHQVVLYY